MNGSSSLQENIRGCSSLSSCIGLREGPKLREDCSFIEMVELQGQDEIQLAFDVPSVEVIDVICVHHADVGWMWGRVG